jgi:secondary thiamine-phosphate synthase enzyme
MLATQPEFNDLHIFNDLLRLRTELPLQFIDLTTWVDETVRRSGVGHGQVQIQVLHTTAAIVVNENEPLLLEDFKELLERIAPENREYAHDDLERRRVNLVPGERSNGHAHARALLLGAAKLFNVIEGRVELGRWQSIFLVELDGPRKRTISITASGRRRNSA